MDYENYSEGIFIINFLILFSHICLSQVNIVALIDIDTEMSDSPSNLKCTASFIEYTKYQQGRSNSNGGQFQSAPTNVQHRGLKGGRCKYSSISCCYIYKLRLIGVIVN